MKRLLLMGLIVGFSQTLWAQSTAEIEARVEALLQQMTLKEKIGQMNQLSAGDMETNYQLAREGLAGSILSISGPEIANKAQRIAVEESRLGIPIIFGRDVIHGYKTIFPIPLGQAATFNPELVEQGSRIAAIEASATGLRWTFAPMLDITTDPRWGRIAESCGEDPYLCERMAEAYVHGFQGEDLSSPTSIAACAKHFAGYGGSEGGRDYNSTFFTERQFRNSILRPFHAAIDAGAATIMTGFNDNDGIPSSGNEWLLKTILREEWGFDGFVVSDWVSITEMIAHGFSENPKQAAKQALTAGVDMEMVSGSYIANIAELIEEGEISIAQIDDAVRNILRVKFRLGLFEHPYTEENRVEIFYNSAHLDAAKETAIQASILIKNAHQLLPLSTDLTKIAVFGPMADAPHDQLGTWVFDGDKNHTQTPLQALREFYDADIEILYDPILTHSRDTSTARISKAVELASEADVAIVFVGEESILSGEAHSLTHLNLRGAQSELIQALSETETPLITVVMAGRPLTISNEVEASDAVLFSFAPGTMGGPGIIDLLFGKSIPSGRLPVTFPRVVGQIPIYYNHRNTGRPADGSEVLIDDIPREASQTSLGNRSYYLDEGNKPYLPFGFGLSYTTFEYSNLVLDRKQVKLGDEVTITFLLSNTGKFDAEEVVQLYTRDVAASVSRPVKELKYFERVFLKAGESKQVAISLSTDELAFWNIEGEKITEPGEFNIWVGGNSEDLIGTMFEVTD